MTHQQKQDDQLITKQLPIKRKDSSKQSKDQPITKQKPIKKKDSSKQSKDQPITKQQPIKKKDSSKQSKDQPITKQQPIKKKDSSKQSKDQPITKQPSINKEDSSKQLKDQPITKQPPIKKKDSSKQSKDQPITEQPSINKIESSTQTEDQPENQSEDEPITAVPSVQQPLGQPLQPATPIVWMERPSGCPDCPPGLEYLTAIDQLHVKQEIEFIELMTYWESCNKYRLLNNMNQQVYYAAEESNPIARQVAGYKRAFVIHLTDTTGAEVMRVRREFICCGGCMCCMCIYCACSDCAAMEVQVEDANGETLGFVRQTCSCCSVRYQILDSNRTLEGYIDGPDVCPPSCNPFADQKFRIRSTSGTKMGAITKHWSGFLQQFYTDAQKFSITFPLDMDVRMKATVVGALFLLDFMFYDSRPANSGYVASQ